MFTFITSPIGTLMRNLKLTIPCALVLLCLWMTLSSGCDSAPQANAAVAATVPSTATSTTPAPVVADATTILNRPEVPILCYHQLRDFRSSDSKTAKDYIVTVGNFQEQVKLLADSGYHTILPDQLYDYLAYGKQLPTKPVMITFDDTRLDQYTLALPELNKYGFKAVFFIMTVSLGRPGYMNSEQVKQLSDEGHTIGSHTWDHQNVKKFLAEDWIKQVEKPSKQLQTITGKKIEYFAYPFGLWNKEAIVKLKEHGFKSVFQLSAHRDDNDPLFSIRRIIVPGEWGAATVLKVMKNSFKASL
jgi:peptidoglycan/xylan/chitin deacetylase (PgdA/CDA1 family)